MRLLLLWLFYLLALLAFALPHGAKTVLVPFHCTVLDGPDCQTGALTPLSTNADIIRLYRTADAAFVAAHAKDYVERHAWGEVTGWPLWPPGMMVTQTFLYWLSPAAPVALVLLVMGAVLWSSVLASMASSFRAWGTFTAMALPLLLLLMPELGYYFHAGVFYSESFSTGFFLLGAGALAGAAYDRNKKRAVLAGVFFALSSYMRAQTDLVMSVMLLFWLGGLAVYFARYYRPGFKAAVKASGWMGAVALTLLSYHCVTLPYRAAHGMQWIDMSGSPMWPPTWEYKKDLTPELDFYRTGGGVEGCEADPVRCAFIHEQRAEKKAVFTARDYFHFTLDSMLEHPFNWATLKAPYLWKFWMEVPGEGAMLLIALPLLLIICMRERNGAHAVFALMLVATGIGIMGPLVMTHFESRYLYQFKLLIPYITLAVAGGGFWRKRAK